MRTVAIALAIALAVPGAVAAGEGLTQRAWLLQGVPAESTLSALRAGGVDGLVLPAGSVTVEAKSCRLTLTPLPDLGSLASWSLTPLVWVAGEGESAGDADTFLDEFAPVERLLRGGGPMVLAARAPWPGLVDFAATVARRRGGVVEVLLPARDAARVAHGEVPATVHLLVVALGNPPAAGFPVTTPADDLAALDEIDAARVPYRVAIVVAPLATPAPPGVGAAIEALAVPRVAEYRPAERGDSFVLRQRLDWGGMWLSPGDTVRVETVDTARLDRDLGLLLRAVRPHLSGWDVVGLPARAPALGLSLEAFLDYLQGGLPGPVPQTQVEWLTPTRLQVALSNPTPHGSAVATTGNFVEVLYDGTQVLDVALGDFSGADFGRAEAGAWRRAVAREANAVRLFLTYLAPTSRAAGASLTFFSRPASVRTRWVVRLSEGSEVSGETVTAPSFRKP